MVNSDELMTNTNNHEGKRGRSCERNLR